MALPSLEQIDRALEGVQPREGPPPPPPARAEGGGGLPPGIPTRRPQPQEAAPTRVSGLPPGIPVRAGVTAPAPQARQPTPTTVTSGLPGAAPGAQVPRAAAQPVERAVLLERTMGPKAARAALPSAEEMGYHVRGGFLPFWKERMTAKWQRAQKAVELAGKKDYQEVGGPKEIYEALEDRPTLERLGLAAVTPIVATVGNLGQVPVIGKPSTALFHSAMMVLATPAEITEQGISQLVGSKTFNRETLGVDTPEKERAFQMASTLFYSGPERQRQMYEELLKQPDVRLHDLEKLQSEHAIWWREMLGQIILDPLNLVGAGGKQIAQTRRIDDAAKLWTKVDLRASDDIARELAELGTRRGQIAVAERFKDKALAVVNPRLTSSFRYRVGEDASQAVAQVMGTSQKRIYGNLLREGLTPGTEDFVRAFEERLYGNMKAVTSEWARLASSDPAEVAEAAAKLERAGFGTVPSSTAGRRTALFLRKLMERPDGSLGDLTDALKLAQQEGLSAEAVVEAWTKKAARVLEDLIPESAVEQHFMVKYPRRLVQWRKPVDEVFARLYMGMNPGYAWRNLGSNMAASVVQGMSPFRAGSKYAQGTERLGFPVLAASRGIGPAQVGAQKPGLTTFSLWFGQQGEKYSSTAIVGQARREAIGRLWKGATKDLNVDELALDPETTRWLKSRVRSAGQMGPDEIDEIERELIARLGGPGGAPAAPAVPGPAPEPPGPFEPWRTPSAELVERLEQTGDEALENALAILRDAETPDEALEGINEMMRRYGQHTEGLADTAPGLGPVVGTPAGEALGQAARSGEFGPKDLADLGARIGKVQDSIVESRARAFAAAMDSRDPGVWTQYIDDVEDTYRTTLNELRAEQTALYAQLETGELTAAEYADEIFNRYAAAKGWLDRQYSKVIGESGGLAVTPEKTQTALSGLMRRELAIEAHRQGVPSLVLKSGEQVDLADLDRFYSLFMEHPDVVPNRQFRTLISKLAEAEGITPQKHLDQYADDEIMIILNRLRRRENRKPVTVDDLWDERVKAREAGIDRGRYLPEELRLTARPGEAPLPPAGTDPAFKGLGKRLEKVVGDLTDEMYDDEILQAELDNVIGMILDPNATDEELQMVLDFTVRLEGRVMREGAAPVPDAWRTVMWLDDDGNVIWGTVDEVLDLKHKELLENWRSVTFKSMPDSDMILATRGRAHGGGDGVVQATLRDDGTLELVQANFMDPEELSIYAQRLIDNGVPPNSVWRRGGTLEDLAKGDFDTAPFMGLEAPAPAGNLVDAPGAPGFYTAVTVDEAADDLMGSITGRIGITEDGRFVTRYTEDGRLIHEHPDVPNSLKGTMLEMDEKPVLRWELKPGDEYTDEAIQAARELEEVMKAQGAEVQGRLPTSARARLDDIAKRIGIDDPDDAALLVQGEQIPDWLVTQSDAVPADYFKLVIDPETGRVFYTPKGHKNALYDILPPDRVDKMGGRVGYMYPDKDNVWFVQAYQAGTEEDILRALDAHGWPEDVPIRLGVRGEDPDTIIEVTLREFRGEVPKKAPPVLVAEERTALQGALAELSDEDLLARGREALEKIQAAEPEQYPSYEATMWLVQNVYDREKSLTGRYESYRRMLENLVEDSEFGVEVPSGFVRGFERAAYPASPLDEVLQGVSEGPMKLTISRDGEYVFKDWNGVRALEHSQLPEGLRAWVDEDMIGFILDESLKETMPGDTAWTAAREATEALQERYPGIHVDFIKFDADDNRVFWEEGAEAYRRAGGAFTTTPVADIRPTDDFAGVIQPGERAPGWIVMGEHPAGPDVGIRLTLDRNTGQFFVHHSDHPEGVRLFGTADQQFELADGGINFIVLPDREVIVFHASQRPLRPDEWQEAAEALRRIGYPDDSMLADYMQMQVEPQRLGDLAPPPAAALEEVDAAKVQAAQDILYNAVRSGEELDPRTPSWRLGHELLQSEFDELVDEHVVQVIRRDFGILYAAIQDTRIPDTDPFVKAYWKTFKGLRKELAERFEPYYTVVPETHVRPDFGAHHVAQDMVTAFGIEPEAAEAVATVFDGFAQTWAKALGVDPAEFYRRKFRGAIRGISEETLGPRATWTAPRHTGSHGIMDLADDGSALIRGVTDPDLATALHEVGHVVRKNIFGDVLDDLAEYYGAERVRWAMEPGGLKKEVWAWTTEMEEQFANDFVNYIQGTMQPPPKLKKAFDALKDALANFWRWVRDYKPIPVPEDRMELFARLFGEGEPWQVARTWQKKSIADLLESGELTMADVTTLRSGEARKFGWALYEEARPAGGLTPEQIARRRKRINEVVDRALERQKAQAKAEAAGAEEAQRAARFDRARMSAAQPQAFYVQEYPNGVTKEIWFYHPEWTGEVPKAQHDEWFNGMLEAAYKSKEAEARQAAEAATAIKAGEVEPPGPTPQAADAARVAGEDAVRRLQELAEEVRALADLPPPPTPRAPIPRAPGEFGEFFDTLRGRWSETQAMASDVARRTRDFILLDYDDRRFLDPLIQAIYPWAYWHTRSIPNWAVALVQNPAALAAYAKYKRWLRDWNDQDPTVPEWAKGLLTLHPPGVRGSVYLDWEATLNPLYAATQNFDDPDREHGAFGQVLAALDKFGPAPHPLLAMAYAAERGLTQKDAAAVRSLGYLAPATRAFSSLTGRVIEPWLWVRDPKTGELQAWKGGTKWDLARATRVLGAEMEAEGEITGAEAKEAAARRAGPAFEQALQRSLEMRRVPAVASLMLGLRVTPRTEWENELTVRGSAYQIRRAQVGPKQAAQEVLTEAPWLSTVWMAYDNDRERMEALAWDTLYRVPPGADLSAAFDKVGLSEEMRQAFYDTSGDLSGWDRVDYEHFVRGILQLSELLGGPDATTAREWREARNRRADLYDRAEEAWPGIQDVQKQYWDIRRVQGKEAANSFAGNTQLFEYWDWLNSETLNDELLLKYYADAEDVDRMAKSLMAEAANIRWPGIYEVQDGYYALPKAQRRGYLAQHPELKAYWDWKGPALEEYQAGLGGLREAVAADDLFTVELPERPTIAQRAAYKAFQEGEQEEPSTPTTTTTQATTGYAPLSGSDITWVATKLSRRRR